MENGGPPLPVPAAGLSSVQKKGASAIRIGGYQPIPQSVLKRNRGASSKANNDIVILEQALLQTPKPSPLPRHLAPPVTSMRASLMLRLTPEQREAWEKAFPADPHAVINPNPSSTSGDNDFKHDTYQIHKKN